MPQSRLSRWLDRTTLVLGLLFTLYHCALVFGVFQGALEHYTNHLAGALMLGGLTAFSAAIGRRRAGVVSAWLVPGALLVLLALAVISVSYIRLDLARLETLATFLEPRDMVVGAMLLAAILGITWALWGLVITLVVSVAIAYFFLGQHAPEPIAHFGFAPSYVMSYLGMGLTSGLFKWVPLSADTIFLFMVFGSLVNRLHLHQLFTELGKAIGNVIRGGVAFPALVGSACIGTVTGNSIGNVVLTGSMTIPLMKRFGYPPSSAAAIESVASSGGQIMPPIMGLGVFIMASFLNVPYIDAALRGTVPALLYFIGAGIAIFLLTRSLGIQSTRLGVDWKVVARLAPTFLLSFGVLLTLLLHRYSENYAALYGIATMIVLSFFQGTHRPRIRDVLLGLAEGGINGAQLAVLVIAAGALAQTVEITGVADIAYDLIANTLLGANALVALILCMFVVIVLGTGMPTAIAYVLGAITMAPILQNLGVDRFAVHFFIFYFAVFANNTPPVALNVSAAARIAGAPFWESCWRTMVLSAPGFLLPFAFVYNPSLLDFPRMSVALVVPSVITLLAILAAAAAAFGYFRSPLGPGQRALFLVTAAVGFGYVTQVDVRWLAAFGVCLAGSMALAWSAPPATEEPSTAGSTAERGE